MTKFKTETPSAMQINAVLREAQSLRNEALRRFTAGVFNKFKLWMGRAVRA